MELPVGTKVVLVRHGESEGNAAAVMQGRGEYPLSARGRDQAAAAAEVVRSWPVARWWSSDLSRARDTAEVLSAGAPVVCDHRLAERGAGKWEGLPRAALAEAFPGALEDDDARPDDFEPEAEVVARCVEVLEALALLDGVTVVVGHGAVMRIVSRHLGGDGGRLGNLDALALGEDLSVLGVLGHLADGVGGKVDGGAARCVFCQRVLGGGTPLLARGVHTAAFADAFPSAPGHTLVVPRRHVARLDDLDDDEYTELWELVRAQTRRLAGSIGRGPDAFTVGVNDGAAAGQTVPHVHVHVIPRHHGDTPSARGGVRWVLPHTAPYWDDEGPGGPTA